MASQRKEERGHKPKDEKPQAQDESSSKTAKLKARKVEVLNGWENSLNDDLDNEKVPSLKGKREDQLRRLVESRKQTLNKERLKVQQEFNENIEQLYAKAVQLHRSGLIEEAQKMFNEINLMKPGFKDTQKFLSKIDKDLRHKNAEISRKPR